MAITNLEKIKKLKEFAAEVEKMRSLQRQFFATRNRDTLNLSKQQEKAVDKMINEILSEQQQGELGDMSAQRVNLSIGDIVRITLPFPQKNPQTFTASVVAIQTGGTCDDGEPKRGMFHLSIPATSMQDCDGDGSVDIRSCHLDEDGRFCYEYRDEETWVHTDSKIKSLQITRRIAN